MVLRCRIPGWRWLACLWAAGLAFVGPVRADDDATVTTELIAEVLESVSAPDGRTTFRYAPATILSQGEIVYYTVRINNPTPVFLRDVIVVQRIPVNTTYVPGSAAGPGAIVSISTDGGLTFAAEVREDARRRSANARPDERLTHLRWKLRYPLAPGATALARFQAVFN